MKPTHCLLMLLALITSACVTPSGDRSIEHKLQAWVGQDVQVLIDAWGRPSSLIRGANGNLVYVYQSHSSVTTPISTSTAYDISTLRAHSEVSGGERKKRWCKVAFEVDLDGVIAAAHQEGNDCKSG